jgi:hypothetical protein
VIGLMRRAAYVIGLIALLLAAPGTAAAASRAQIIRDCADDGYLQGSYSPAELRDARQNLPSDVAEYTDCSDVLRRAELGGDGGGDDPGTSGGGPAGPLGGESGRTPGEQPAPVPTPPLVPETDADRAALDGAQAAPQQTVSVGGEDLVAGASPLRDGYRGNAMPSSLVITLILLGLAGLALLSAPLRRLAGVAWRRRAT